jgi:hypothetical protein
MEGNIFIKGNLYLTDAFLSKNGLVVYVKKDVFLLSEHDKVELAEDDVFVENMFVTMPVKDIFIFSSKE